MFFTTETKKKQITPTTSPSTIAPIGPTYPDAGVIATSPATAPEHIPSSDGSPLMSHSAKSQDRVAADVAMNVLTKVRAVTPLASRLEPALKPNQPTQSRDAPIMVMTSEWGGIGSRG